MTAAPRLYAALDALSIPQRRALETARLALLMRRASDGRFVAATQPFGAAHTRADVDALERAGLVERIGEGGEFRQITSKGARIAHISRARFKRFQLIYGGAR